MTEWPPPMALTIPDAAARLGVPTSTVAKAVRDGEIPSIRLGRRYIIPVSRLEEWLAQ